MSRAQRLHLRLPATSANLGPGFDALGLALGFALHVDAEVAPGFHITAAGRDAHRIAEPESSLILQTYREILEARRRPVVPLQLRIENEIPLGMGCGSSAAALVAGVALANHFGGLGWTEHDVLLEASRREGHPDNVAACLLGGLTVSSMTDAEDGATKATAISVPAPASWPLLLVFPNTSLSTQKARALLPESYSKADAIGNVQNTALLTAAFAAGRGDLLRTAMQDRMHQPYRSPLVPLLAALLPLAGLGDVLGVALSGAGPSVLLILRTDAELATVEQTITEQLHKHQLNAECLHTYIGRGAVITPLDYP